MKIKLTQNGQEIENVTAVLFSEMDDKLDAHMPSLRYLSNGPHKDGLIKRPQILSVYVSTTDDLVSISVESAHDESTPRPNDSAR